MYLVVFTATVMNFVFFGGQPVDYQQLLFVNNYYMEAFVSQVLFIHRYSQSFKVSRAQPRPWIALIENLNVSIHGIAQFID